MLLMMIPSATVAIFLLTSAALAAVPGPDNIFVLTQSALHGRKAGIVITMGLCTGLLVHTLLVALGVAAILQASPLAFSALKAIGAVYLLYLALLAIQKIPIEPGNDEIPAVSHSDLYSRGIIMNLTNPKVAVFFLAFLPQFTNSDYGLAITLQIIVLGGLFIIMAFFVFTTIAFSAGLIGKWLTTNIRAQRAINYMAALIYCGLALNIVLT
jgi:threonine/homoserine/homoserine lactone efflux protein